VGDGGDGAVGLADLLDPVVAGGDQLVERLLQRAAADPESFRQVAGGLRGAVPAGEQIGEQSDRGEAEDGALRHSVGDDDVAGPVFGTMNTHREG
jgi:hypothetical protein